MCLCVCERDREEERERERHNDAESIRESCPRVEKGEETRLVIYSLDCKKRQSL